MRLLCRMMLKQCPPRAEIVPAEITWDAVKVRPRLALRRSGLQHRVIDADVLALRIQLLEHRLDLRGLLDHAPEFFLVGDDMIRRKHPDHRVGVLSLKDERRQPYSGSGIATQWLGDNLLLRQLRQLLGNAFAKVTIGDNPESLR